MMGIPFKTRPLYHAVRSGRVASRWASPTAYGLVRRATWAMSTYLLPTLIRRRACSGDEGMTRKQERNQADLWRETRRAGSTGPRRSSGDDDLREFPERAVAAVGGAHDVGLLPNILESVAGTGG